MTNQVRISLFGDICPTNDTRHHFEKGDAEALLGDVKSIISNSVLLYVIWSCEYSKAKPQLNRS